MRAALRTVAIKYRMLQAALGFSTQNTNSSVDCIDNGSTVSTTLSDPKRLADIVTMEKGKKMVALVMTARLPSQAKAMLPTTLRVVLSKPPIRREDIDKEPLGSNRFVLESAAIADDIIMSAAFSVVSSTAYPFAYTAAKACIENVMMPHIKNSTLNTALGVKSRANVMQEILNKGSKMVASEPLSAQKHFDVIKCAFLELARKK